MGFTCETEYFGLVECNKDDNGDTSNRTNPTQYYDWINLRNPLGQHGNAAQPYLLALRVKFWVPAHLILQENVRNIFYMQARMDLLEGRLCAPDWETAAKLSALIAQADEIKFDRNAISSNSDGTSTTPSEQIVSNNDCNRNNTDNDDASSIASTSEIPNVGCVSLSSLSGSGKDTINKRKKRKLSKKTLSLDNYDEIHVDGVDETCDHSPLRIYENYVIHAEDSCGSKPNNLNYLIGVEHSKLITTTAKSAKYWLLQSIFNLKGFGEETFSGVRVSLATSHNHNHHHQQPNQTPSNVLINNTFNNCSSSMHNVNNLVQRCDISVGPHGLLISLNDEQLRYVFSLILIR